MLQVNKLRTETELVKQGLAKRGWKTEDFSKIDDIIALDDLRKATQTQLDELLSSINTKSKEIGQLFQQGKQEEAQALKAQIPQIKLESKALEDKMHQAMEALHDKLVAVGNIPHISVPDGQTEEHNEVYQAWDGTLPSLGDAAQAHWDLATKYNIIDFGLGAKITGSGFPLFRQKGAKLQRALINFFLDQANAAGYEEIVPPLLVNGDTAFATGQLPDKEGQMYHTEKDNLYLIPTGEVPITNIYRDVILDESELPIKLTGYTPCFRREAGSYGSDVKGLNRVHQFDKIEIIQLVHPDKSYDTLMEMVAHVEDILKKLELPYRILRLCGGDLGFASALTYDFEVFAAAQQRWLEVSSVSNFETFQSTRLKLRYKDSKGKKHLAHTLNGSALALARIVAAILENNQTDDGIKIPPALIPYTGFDLIN